MTTAISVTQEPGLPLPIAAEPLPIIVTDGGALVVQMHTLLRQIVPLLEQPNSVPDRYRQQLAERVKTLLLGIPEEELGQEDGYEPGCWREEAVEETEEPW